MLLTRNYVQQDKLPPNEKGPLRAVSLFVLSYVEQQKERLGADVASDHCALEITKVLADTLTDPKDLARVKVLHNYFSSRFVDERAFLYE